MRPPPRRPRLSVARAGWALVRHDPRAYLIGAALWVTFFTWPLAIGYVLKVALDRVASDAPLAGVWTVLAVLAALEVGRWVLLAVAATQWSAVFVGWLTLPRVNLLRSLLTGAGPAAGRLPTSSGEALSRFRDDTADVAMVPDSWVDLVGYGVSSSIALVVLVSVDPLVALGVAVPAGLAVLVNLRLGPALRRWRQDSRERTAEVTAFLGDLFDSVLTVKTAGAVPAALDRYDALNRARRAAALKDQVGTALIQTISGSTGGVGIGLALLLAAPAARDGRLGVGDLGLVTSYVTVIAAFPRWVGRLAAIHRQAEVSVERLAELAPPDAPGLVVAQAATHLRTGPPPLPPAPSPGPADRLERLAVEGLTATYAGGRGIVGVDLEVRRGELVVITGPVGAGKSTLVRALLGLVARQGGTIRWNDDEVLEPEVVLVPPRVAYLPQVPRLFSEALRDTVLLGAPGAGLEEALRLARLEEDVAAMPDGLDTVVGARGVRLSGGQVQRAAAARMLVRRPELLVVDDLSSALDVETEAALWDGLFAGGELTALVVSHRPRVLGRADVVLELPDGRVLGR